MCDLLRSLSQPEIFSSGSTVPASAFYVIGYFYERLMEAQSPVPLKNPLWISEPGPGHRWTQIKYFSSNVSKKYKVLVRENIFN